jgi:hypothetical protein
MGLERPDSRPDIHPVEVGCMIPYGTCCPFCLRPELDRVLGPRPKRVGGIHPWPAIVGGKVRGGDRFNPWPTLVVVEVLPMVETTQGPMPVAAFRSLGYPARRERQA